MVESANKSKSHTVNGQYLLEKARVAQTRIREVAREYLRRGWKPIPISARKKYPNNSGWQLNEVTLDNIDSQFMLGHTNIGVQFGPVSNGLCDVDLDCAEARELARVFLPETGAVFGRRSSPAAHWLYQSDIWQQVNTAATTFEDPIVAADDDEHGVMLVELRTGRVGKNKVVKGALSLFPPSRHPSGERVQWDKDGEPARVDGAELSRCVKSLAAAALLVRHYPSKGKQHKAIGLVLGGWLARAGWDESRIAHFVEAVARTAGDAEWQDRVTAAKGAASKLANGEQEIPGTPRMRAVFGDDVVDALADWLDIGLGIGPSTRGDETTEQPAPRSIEQVLDVFQRWFLLKDSTPVYAALGTIAANLLSGDPIWLGLVAPPSNAKTEILNSTARLPCVVPAATLTLGALLSGTPKKQQLRGATGGLLRQIGNFGVLVLKDFTSILSMRPDAKNEVLAALREIYDGRWTRHLGTDGGRTLEWRGKMGLLFGVTGVIDKHYGVIGAMGDRFLLCRTGTAEKGQFIRALQHAGGAAKTMRAELAEGNREAG